jgi:hypothetical protein
MQLKINSSVMPPCPPFQVYALTGLPGLFLTFGEASDKAHRKWATAFAIPRVALLWTAILLNGHASIRALLFIIAGSIYLVEILFTVVRRRKAATPDTMTAAGKLLFYGAHFSIINFGIDMCSNGIKTMRIQHVVSIVANLVAISIVLVGLFLVDPYERAWKCYQTRDIYKYDEGLCPQWIHYYGPYRHQSTSNSGDITLVCRNRAFTSRYNAACTTGEIQASLPIFWHLASLIVTVSFTLSFSLVRSKIREIRIAGVSLTP